MRSRCSRKPGRPLHLHDAHGSADLAHPVVQPHVLDLVGAGVAAVGEHALVDAEGTLLGDAVGQVVAAGDDHAALAGGDVLDGVEREAADVADQAHVACRRRVAPSATAASSTTYRSCAAGDLHQAVHVHRQAEVVHQADRPGALGDQAPRAGRDRCCRCAARSPGTPAGPRTARPRGRWRRGSGPARSPRRRGPDRWPGSSGAARPCRWRRRSRAARR